MPSAHALSQFFFGFFLRFRFGDRKEILRDRLEEFERPFWSLKTP